MKKISLYLIILIVLITINYKTSAQKYVAQKAEQEPVIDGIDDDACWRAAEWQYLEYDWFLPYNGEPLSQKYTLKPADFTGRFKVSWTPDKLYFLVEITDDILNEDNPDPLVLYYEDDCLEIFIDENKSGGEHTNNNNAFAYHISPVTLNAIDIDLTGRANFFDNHLTIKANYSVGSYCLEIGMNVYNESYNFGLESTSKVTLFPGKELGFSMAYCEDDGNNRENFIGWIPGGLNSYANADLFGNLLLTGNIDVKAVTYCNNNFGRKNIKWLKNYEYTDSLSRNYTVTSAMKLREKGSESRKSVEDTFSAEKKEYFDENEELIAINNFSYNKDKKITEETFEIRNDTFPGAYRELFTYLNDYQFEKIIQYKVENNWVNDTKIIQTNTKTGQLSEKIMKIWKAGQWEDYYKYNYEYDFKNRIDYMITYESDGSAWYNSQLEKYEYFMQGDKTYYNYYIQKWVGEWINDFSIISSINKAGSIISECRQHNGKNIYTKRRITETSTQNGKETINESRDYGNYQIINKIIIENLPNATYTTTYDQGGLKINKLELKEIGEKNIDELIATSYYNGEEIGIFEEKYYYAGNLSDCKAEILGDQVIEDKPVTLKAKYDLFDIEWYRDNKLVSFDPEIKISKGGEYKLVVRTPVCEDTKSIIITGSLPDCNAKIIADEATDNKTITLTSQSGSVSSYQWWLGGIVVGNSPQLTVTEPGRYKLLVKTEWCEDEDNITIKKENLNNIETIIEGLEIAPNPTTGQISVINNSDVDIIKLCVYNSYGQKIKEENNLNKKYFLDLATYGIGLFVFELYLKNGNKVYSKIIKQ